MNKIYLLLAATLAALTIVAVSAAAAPLRLSCSTGSLTSSCTLNAAGTGGTLDATDSTGRAGIYIDSPSVLAPLAQARFGFDYVCGDGTTTSCTGLQAAATATLYVTGTPLNGDTVTIGSRTYTLKTTPTATDDVAIGGSGTNALTNLKKAVNLTGVAGTDYGTGTVIHPTVTAGAITSSTLLLSAKTTGSAGNQYATRDTGSGLGFIGSTFTGGTDPVLDLSIQIDTTGDRRWDASAYIFAINGCGSVSTSSGCKVLYVDPFTHGSFWYASWSAFAAAHPTWSVATTNGTRVEIYQPGSGPSAGTVTSTAVISNIVAAKS